MALIFDGGSGTSTFELSNGETMTLSRVYNSSEGEVVVNPSGDEYYYAPGYWWEISDSNGTNYLVLCYDSNDNLNMTSQLGFVAEISDDAISSGAYFEIYYLDNIWYEWSAWCFENGLNDNDFNTIAQYFPQAMDELGGEYLGEVLISGTNWEYNGDVVGSINAGSNMRQVKFDGTDVKRIVYDGSPAWAKPYTLTIATAGTTSAINSYSVSRSTTYEPSASTGALSSGATIYHDDYLYLSASAKSSVITYTPSSLSTPTLTSSFTSGASTSSLVVTNPNSTSCTIYYKLSSASSYSSTTVGSSSSKTITGLTPEATYNVYLSTYQTKHTTSYSVSPSSSNITVSGNTTVTFTGSSSTSQEITTTAVNSSTASLKLDGVLAPTCSISRTNSASATHTLHAYRSNKSFSDTYTPDGTITSAVITGKRSNSAQTTFIAYNVSTKITRGSYSVTKTGSSVTLSSTEIASLNAQSGAITIICNTTGSTSIYYHSYLDISFTKPATVSYSATNTSSYSVTMTLRLYVGGTLTATKTGTVASGGTLSGDTYSTTTAGSGYCNAYATYSSKNSPTTTSSTVTWV